MITCSLTPYCPPDSFIYHDHDMTMTSVLGGQSVTVDPEVTVEASPGLECSPTCETHVGGCCSRSGGGLSLACFL